MKPLTGLQFIAWQDHMRLSNRKAAHLLGIRPATIAVYREKGAAILVARACREIASGLDQALWPWEE